MKDGNDFDTDLRRSHEDSALWCWEAAYRRLFPGFVSMRNVQGDYECQRNGIDRLVRVSGERLFSIEEKIRYQEYNDVLLEIWSDLERRIPGWARRALLCDYLAYFVKPSGRFHLVPFIDLRVALNNNMEEWLKYYGYKDADNQGRYVTRSIPVPVHALTLAVPSMRTLTLNMRPQQELFL